MKKVTAGLLTVLLSSTSLQSATLLPNGQQQFIDGNGNPYASGKVYFYSNFPTCTVPKNTWFSSTESSGNLNTNPVILDSAGRATIFGSGTYCQVLQDSNGNTIWTKQTGDTTSTSTLGWGANGGGTSNAQTVTVSGFSATNGQTFYYVAGATNTGALTLSVNATTPIAVVKPTTAGTSQLTGGEVVSGNVVGVTYYSTTGQFQLITNNSGSNTSGQIAAYASQTCPAGWLVANGAAVSRTTYSGLYNNILTTWGAGDGSTTFNLPDLRGTFLRGTGTNANATVVAAGGAVGQAVGTYAADTYLNHSHAVTDPGHLHTYSGFTTTGIAAAGSAYTLPSAYPTQNTSSNTTGLTVNTSTTGGTETKPKNFAVTYCIQY
jgi:microcystin-dependent protein